MNTKDTQDRADSDGKVEETKNKPSWKKCILGLGLVAGAVAGIIYCVKHEENLRSAIGKCVDAISSKLKKGSNRQPISQVISIPIEESIADIICVGREKISIPTSDALRDNIVGRTLTPTSLGEIAVCSPQEVNKRLINAGLQKKLPCGEYEPIGDGKILGTPLSKVTKYGHAFSNIEWDESVLRLLFSEEELAEAAAKKEELQKLKEGCA